MDNKLKFLYNLYNDKKIVSRNLSDILDYIKK